MDMDKAEINKQIAKLLGFKAYGITNNGVKNSDFGWEYPKKYKNQLASVPQRVLPDFVLAIDTLIEFSQTITSFGTIPKDFCSQADYDDLE